MTTAEITRYGVDIRPGEFCSITVSRPNDYVTPELWARIFRATKSRWNRPLPEAVEVPFPVGPYLPAGAFPVPDHEDLNSCNFVYWLDRAAGWQLSLHHYGRANDALASFSARIFAPGMPQPTLTFEWRRAAPMPTQIPKEDFLAWADQMIDWGLRVQLMTLIEFSWAQETGDRLDWAARTLLGRRQGNLLPPVDYVQFPSDGTLGWHWHGTLVWGALPAPTFDHYLRHHQHFATVAREFGVPYRALVRRVRAMETLVALAGEEE